MPLSSQLEALLFALAQPVSKKKLADACQVDVAGLQKAIEELSERYVSTQAGVRLVEQGNEVEIVTAPDAAELVRRVLQLEMQSELSKASLEALSILSYRGPLTRPQLEQIRGVQSALILRNLSMRGLVDVREGGPHGQPLYTVSLEFLKHLGVERIEALPEYLSLHKHDLVERLLNDMDAPTASSTQATLI